MLKGKAIIELTNVKTGEVEKYEEDNIITNVIQDILSMNPRGRLFHYYYGYNNYGFFPIVPNLIGGILLYEDPLEEDPNKYYASDNNLLIGYSSNVVNTNEDLKRGSMNQTESQEIINGYKFVFDFQTSQGNGTISSLGLTSKWGGMGGYGSIYEQNPIYNITYGTSIDFKSSSAIPKVMPYTHTVSYEYNKDIFISIYPTGTSSFTIKTYRGKMQKWSLLDYSGFYSRDELSSTTITTEIFATGLGSSTTGYYCFLDDKKHNSIWGFQHNNNNSGNSSDNAIINYIKINKEDFSFIEGTIEIPAQLYYFGYMPQWGYMNAANYGYQYCDRNAIIKDGYLYCCNYNRNGVYKINLEDITDIIFITSPVKIEHYGNNDHYYGKTMFNINGNIIYFEKGYIFKDKIYQTIEHGNCLQNTAAPGLQFGPFLFSQRFYSRNSSSGHNVTDYFYLMTPYLATINNLENPIEKTEDKTMKITYILTEVEEEEASET